MEQWYALYTKPNAEYQVAEALQQRGFQTYLPEIETRRKGRRRRQPLFPTCSTHHDPNEARSR